MHKFILVNFGWFNEKFKKKSPSRPRKITFSKLRNFIGFSLIIFKGFTDYFDQTKIQSQS